MIVAIEIAWLFLVLPIFETAHFRFFNWMYGRSSRQIRLFDWYLEFIHVLKRRPAKEPEFYIAFARKGLLYVSLVVPLAGLSTFVNGDFSLLSLLGLVFCLGIVHLLMGFTFQGKFIALSSLEKTLLRQSVVLVFLVALIAIPFVNRDITIHQLMEAQAIPLLGTLPAYGVFINPVAFLCACVSISLYLKNWQEDEFPSPLLFRKPVQSELFGIEVLAYKIARNLEYILLYTIVVYVFLGGHYLRHTDIAWYYALGIFSTKLFFVAFLTLGIHFCTPRMKRNQIHRVIFLVLLPLEVASYPLSLMLMGFWGMK